MQVLQNNNGQRIFDLHSKTDFQKPKYETKLDSKFAFLGTNAAFDPLLFNKIKPFQSTNVDSFKRSTADKKEEIKQKVEQLYAEVKKSIGRQDVADLHPTTNANAVKQEEPNFKIPEVIPRVTRKRKLEMDAGDTSSPSKK
jgi:hypothetical protein